MGKILAGILGVVAVVLVGIAVVKNGNQSTDNYCRVLEASEENGYIADHVKGSADAPVVIVEYADFQCPGCASVNPLVNSAVEKLDGKVAVVYRNFLLSYHKNGTAAASAAEAAGLQGYWKPFADLLFANQSEWEYATPSERTMLFNEYFMKASDGNGDLDKFLSDISSENISKKINNDMSMAKAVNLQGTPAFYIDGQVIDWSIAGSVEVNGKTVSWDSGRLTADQFVQLFKDIADAKLGE